MITADKYGPLCIVSFSIKEGRHALLKYLHENQCTFLRNKDHLIMCRNIYAHGPESIGTN